MDTTYYFATGEECTAIADAIRAKSGSSEELEFPDDFVSAIENLIACVDATGVSF